MKCVKCGETLTASVCRKCGFSYKDKVIRFLSVPQDVQLYDTCGKTQGKTQSGQTLEEQYKRGINAFIDQDYEEALQCLQLPAENGNANAQFLMGQIFDDVNAYANRYLALYWYEQAGARGNLHAINKLIAYYESADPEDRLEKDRFVQRLKQWRTKKESIEKRERERAMRKKQRKTSFKTEAPSNRRIRTYQEYLNALEAFFLDANPAGGAKQILTDRQISQFISTNKLDVHRGIKVAEVKQDLVPIYAKYGLKSDDAPAAAPKKSRANGSIYSYRGYLNVLTQLYLSSGKQPMSKQQIAEFIKQNDLTRRFGIYEEDVLEDYQFLKRKYG